MVSNRIPQELLLEVVEPIREVNLIRVRHEESFILIPHGCHLALGVVGRVATGRQHDTARGTDGDLTAAVRQHRAGDPVTVAGQPRRNGPTSRRNSISSPTASRSRCR